MTGHHSPDLGCAGRDWSVYALDPLEQPPASVDPQTAATFNGVMTGLGLVSHALQEDEAIINPVSVTGKIIDDNGRESLEVILQLKMVRKYHSVVSNNLME